MDADVYEREHMQIDGPVRFRDRQKGRGTLVKASVIPLLLVAMAVLGLEWSMIAFMGAVGLVGALIEVARASYRVVLTDRTLHVQHGLRVHRIPVSAIESAQVAPARVTDAMVGRGVFKQSFDGTVQSIRAEGLSETVRVRWRQGETLRTTIIGTDRARELAEAITSPAPVRARVAVDAVAEEAEAEVERFLERCHR